MPKDSALSFVGQIMDAYNASMSADGEALKHAIECGKYLNLAQENVEAMTKPKVKWSSWRKKHCPDISQETSSVYMRLASAHAEDESIFAECKSIRDAIKKLPRRRRNASADNSGSGSGANSSALLNPQPASPDLAAMLQDKAVDEIGIALRDADKLDEFETAVILRMTPHKVCVALTKAWTADQLRDLIKRVNEYLSTLTSAPSSSSYRRPPAQPTL